MALTPFACLMFAALGLTPPGQPDQSGAGVVHSTAGYPVEPIRVGGDMDAKTEPRGEYWKSGLVLTDEYLPEGYPKPTPPGAIEIKHYPSVRRAEVTLKAAPGVGSNVGFWPLFRHISRRDIAMTSPVEMDMNRAMTGNDAGAERLEGDDQWTMAFLYRTPELGDTGRDGVVTVVDQPAMTVLAMGVMGPYWPKDLPEKLKELETWLAGQSQWKAAGGARVMAYNGPNIRSSRRWGEVQLPIIRADTESIAPDKEANDHPAPIEAAATPSAPR